MSFLKKLFGFFFIPKEEKGSIGEIKKVLKKSRDGKGRFKPAKKKKKKKARE